MSTAAAVGLPAAVVQARWLLREALAGWIERLEPGLREVCGYQLGLCDENGRRTGSVHGKLLRPAFTLVCARAAGGE
ncbi:hypothetical protein ACFQ08_39900, partial [Streptosporangium algeriense]